MSDDPLFWEVFWETVEFIVLPIIASLVLLVLGVRALLKSKPLK